MSDLSQSTHLRKLDSESVTHYSIEHLTFTHPFQAKILPLRLYVDQDALDFMKKFFSFQDAQADASTDDASDEGIFFRE